MCRKKCDCRIAAFSPLGATQLPGCANVSVESAWQDKVSHSQSFTKILVVGVGPEFNRRCAFEWALASRIRSPATQAFVSCDSMTAEDQLNRENIERVAASVHADAGHICRILEVTPDHDDQRRSSRPDEVLCNS